MLNGVQLDPNSFLAKGRLIIDGIVTTIARFLGIKPNPEDSVSRPERLDQAAFEIRNFCRVKVGPLCWIYLGE